MLGRVGQLAVTLTVVAAAHDARAMHMANIVPPQLVFVGASIADGAIVRATDQPVFGLDATLTQSLFWGSLGARLVQDDRLLFVPYGEVGVWLGINVGGGISVLTNSRTRDALAPHLFLGLPLPISKTTVLDGSGWLIEPYYRPMWWGGNTLHEFGLLVKIGWEPGGGAPPTRPMPVVARPPPEPPLVDRAVPTTPRAPPAPDN